VRADSLSREAPRLAAALAGVSLAALGGFGVAVAAYLWRSNLVL